MIIIKHIPPINFNPNAPALYGQGLTDYEILVRICKVINDCIDKVNSFEDVVKEIQNIIDDLESTLKDKILTLLNEWINDGTIRQMVSEIINKNAIAKSSSLSFNHIARHLFFNSTNWSRSPKSGVEFKGSYIDFTNCQGGCKFIYNNANYFATAMNNGVNTKVIVWRENSHNTIIKSWNIPSPHTQSLYFNNSDNCLYLPLFTNSSNQASDVVYKLNFVTGDMEYKNITAPKGSQKNIQTRWYSIKGCYNYIDKKYELYGFKQYGKVNKRNVCDIYKIDWDNGTSTYIDTVSTPEQYITTSTGENVFIIANMCISNDYILLMSWRPSRIYLFNRSLTNDINATRSPIWIYKIPDIMDNGYLLGEPEDINIDNDNNITLVTLNDMSEFSEPSWIDKSIVTAVRWYNTSLAIGEGSIMGNNNNNESASAVLWARYPSIALRCRYNSDYMNPTGRRRAPFMIAQEAVEFIQTCPILVGGKIILDSDNYVPLFVIGNKPITLEGAVVDESNNLYAFQSGIYGSGCNLLLRRIRITQSCNSTTFGNSNACVYIRNNGNIKITNTVYINRNGYTGDVKVPYDVHCTYSQGFINNLKLPSSVSSKNYITNSNLVIN